MQAIITLLLGFMIVFGGILSVFALISFGIEFIVWLDAVVQKLITRFTYRAKSSDEE